MWMSGYFRVKNPQKEYKVIKLQTTNSCLPLICNYCTSGAPNFTQETDSVVVTVLHSVTGPVLKYQRLLQDLWIVKTQVCTLYRQTLVQHLLGNCISSFKELIQPLASCFMSRAF